MKTFVLNASMINMNFADKLKEHFSSYGKVVEHQIMLDHSTGRSRGFGFVTFESEDAVERVMSEGRMHDLGGKQVTSLSFIVFSDVKYHWHVSSSAVFRFN